MCVARSCLGLRGRALDELTQAIEQHAGDINAWFVDRPPQFSMHPRFYVDSRLVQEIDGFVAATRRYSAISPRRGASRHLVSLDLGPDAEFLRRLLSQLIAISISVTSARSRMLHVSGLSVW